LKPQVAQKRNCRKYTVGHRNSMVHKSHASSFAKVPDGRKQPIRGLWVRNGRYYAQLKIENAITGIKKTKRVHVNRFIEGRLRASNKMNF
jgi:hypothetical protein